MVPEATIESVTPVGDTVFPISPGKAGDQSDHLVVGQAAFVHELVIADAGVGVSGFHDAVEDIFTICSLIQGQVVFLEFLR